MAKKKNGKKAKSKSIAKIGGQGGYYTDKFVPTAKGLVPDGTFADGGAKLGGILANRFLGADASGLGNRVGKSLGSWLSRIVGFGDYAVTDSSLIKRGGAIPAGESVPDFGVRGNEARIRHREFVSDISVPLGIAVFTNLAFVVNPGNVTLFPWLSNVAVSYSEYRINGLVFEFKSMSSPTNTGGPLGTVILACNYDVLEAPFSDKIHMENSQFACSAPPSQSQIHTVECNPVETSNRVKFVRTPASSTAVGQDARLMDHALFQLATTGLAGSAGQVIGELWISYDISFFKPTLTETVGYEGQKIVGNTSITKTAVFGTAPISTGQLYAAPAVNSLTFSQIGTYMISLRLQGTVIGAVMSGTASRQRLGAIVNAAGTDSLWCDVLTVLAIGQTYVIDASGSTTVTITTLEISPFNASLGV